MICSNLNGKSKITRRRPDADKRPRLCTVFDHISFLFLCRMVTASVAMVSVKDNETR